MAGDLTSAIDQAMAICWNEGYGYRLGGMALSYADGVDCSGLTKYCFSKWYGLNLPHSAHEQSKMGTEVSIDNIKCADIVCFDYNLDGRIDHVGIYVGGGVVIHASETRGAVRASSLSGMSGIATIRRLV